jgi:putative hydrolase of the HAD superfamily
MIFYRKLRPIQALTFDLDDTLYNNTPYIIKAEKALSAYLHEHYPASENTDLAFWRQHKNRLLLSHPLLRHDMGRLRKLTLSNGLASLGYRGQTLHQATEDCFHFFYHHRSNFKVSNTICSLLSELAQKKPLVAITNGNVNLAQIGIAQYFQVCYQANIEQPMKPHSSMFDAASQYLQLAPHSILHIGDNLHSDVGGAMAAGYQSAWYAHDRAMMLSKESTQLLPHVQLTNLEELKHLV